MKVVLHRDSADLPGPDPDHRLGFARFESAVRREIKAVLSVGEP